MKWNLSASIMVTNEKVLNSKKMRKLFVPILDRLEWMAEAEPFLLPVDTIRLKIPVCLV